MLRFLTVALLFSSSLASAQTTLDITLPGGAVCSYATGAVSNGSAPGHLQATATSENGAGCGTQSGSVTFGPASPAVALPTTLQSNIGTSSINFQVLNATSCVGTFSPTTGASFTSPGGASLCSPTGTSCSQPISAIASFDNESTTADVTYNVTITCNGTAGQAVSTTNVVVPKKGGIPPGQCLSVTNSAGGTFTRATTVASSIYPNPPAVRDATNYTTVFADTNFPNWPGHYNWPGYFMVPTGNFVSLAFQVPNTFFTGSNLNVYGEYTVSESSSGYSVPISFSISKQCGDFSAETASGSSVVCRANLLSSDQAIAWFSNGTTCPLQNGQTYYLNFINADIKNVLPSGGGSATSDATAKCSGGKCSDVFTNGIGNWH